MIFKALNNESVINTVFTIAGYTYGPLLGLFMFGLFTKYKIKDKWAPVIAVLAPLLSYFWNILAIQCGLIFILVLLFYYLMVLLQVLDFANKKT